MAEPRQVTLWDVRPARPDDFAAWYDLRVVVASEGVWIGAELPVRRDEPAFAARLERDDALDVVVEHEGLPVATLSATVDGGVASFAMWVASTHRGRGIGRVLVDACLEWSGEVRVHKVILEVWPHNGAAIKLYRAAGFAVEGRKVRHYRRRNGELWDALMMAKVLDDVSPGSPLPDAGV